MCVRAGTREASMVLEQRARAGAALFDCAIDGAGTLSAAVSVRGSGACSAAVLRRCSITNCPGSALEVERGGSAVLRECQLATTGLGTRDALIVQGQYAAVTVFQGADLRVEACAFRDNQGHAIALGRPPCGSDATSALDDAGNPRDAGMESALKMAALVTGETYEYILARIRVDEAGANTQGRVLLENNHFAGNAKALEADRRQETYDAPAPFHGPETAIGAALATEETAHEQDRQAFIQGRDADHLLADMLGDLQAADLDAESC